MSERKTLMGAAAAAANAIAQNDINGYLLGAHLSVDEGRVVVVSLRCVGLAPTV